MCAAAVTSNRFETLEPRMLFAAGDLDPSFGGTGKVTFDYLSRSNFAQAVTVQSDGSILVAGFVQTQTTTGNDLLVARFLADGSLDGSFGAGGVVVTNLGSTLDNAVAVAVQPDGKVVVGAQARGAGNTIDFAVVRYNADGSLDAGFGTGGVTLHDLGTGAHDRANAMTLLSDGRIVLVGATTVGGVSQFAVTRYTSAGLLDGTFGGGDGIVVQSFPGSGSEAKAVAALADGSLVVAGVGGGHFAAVHLFTGGGLDTGFGASGWATVDLGGDFEVANAVAVLGDGRVVLAGESENAAGQDVAVARLTAGGLVDTSFGGGDGFVLTDFDGDYDYGAAMHVLPSGHVVVAGSAYVNFESRFAAVRYLADGTPDDSFGAGGNVTHTFAGESTGRALALDGSGRLVVAGHALNLAGNFDFAVARLDNTVNLNLPPVADAGGAYLVHAGSTLLLDGSGSSDEDGSIVAFEWDFDYDGSSFDVDASGVAPTFSAVGLSGPESRTVALRVTDNNGAVHLATATLVVNALPVAHAGGTYLVNAGASVQLDGTASGDADGTIVSYEWDFDYDGSTFNADATGATPAFSAASLAPVVRTVALRVTDNHGATSVVTTTVTVSVRPGSALVVDDPLNPGTKMLLVQGTSAADTLRFRNVNGGSLEVKLGNQVLGTFANFSRVVIDGGAGNDVIDAGFVAVPVVIFGGAGDDKLSGGSSHDVLVGGAGNDQLDGGAGNDVLIGGAGADDLDSRYGDDLLLGAGLAYETDRGALQAVLAEWTRTDLSLSQRIAHLLSGGGHNGSFTLSGGNVVEDNAVDSLSGTDGADWLLTGPGDKLQKIKSK